MTDEDFEEMFQHHVHEGKYDGYLNAEEIETEVWGRKKEEKTTISFPLDWKQTYSTI